MEQPKNNLKIIVDKKNTRVILPNMLTLIGVCIGLTSIRFGSRADVYYENYEPIVKVGQKAISGETLLAKK